MKNKKECRFIHLHCHNEYSILDGLGTAEQYAARAKELGMPAIGMTNHGNVDGQIKFQQACDEAGITAIHGCELYIVEDMNKKEKGENRRHLTVWAKNEEGWKNILKMLTIANSEGFFYRPRISPTVLIKHCRGLIVATACSSSFVLDKWGIDLFKKLKTEISDDLYFEIMPYVGFEPQEKINKMAPFFSATYGAKLLASNDCHFISEEDSVSQEVLLAIQTKKKWKDKDRWKFEIKDIYIKEESEMYNQLIEQKILEKDKIKEAIESTYEIYLKCKDFKIPKREVVLPNIIADGKEVEDVDKFFLSLCRENFVSKVKKHPEKSKKIKVYTERFKEELEVITKQKFVKYFLIVWELIHWCRNNDIMTGPGRGSSGGSLICYLLGITSVDPIEFGLIFARFISPARIDLPDIDMDFEDIKRPLIRKHLEDIYGRYHVAGVSTFMTMKGKGAIRDVSRVFDVPQVDVNKASSCIVTRSGGDFRSDFTIEDAFATFEDGRAFKKKYPKVVDIAMRLEGQVRGKGQHAAAIVISEDDLREGNRACLVKGKKEEELVVNWDKHDIEHVGLMKLDVLGLNALTVLNEARKLVKLNKNIDIDYETIPITDKKIYEEFSKGNTVGCFQFGSLGLRKLCVEMGITDFMMLTHANALYRPGTLRSGMVTEFIQRKNEGKKIKYLHPFLKTLTADTYGIILYQEQVMRMMYELGGLGWKTADTVRKVISKSQGVEQFQTFKKLFAEGCTKKKTLDKKTAEELWDTLSSFGSYSFNLSHAVEYSMISYWDMWCKIYHPVEFICASLTYGSENKKEDLIEEAIRMGLDIRPPKIGKSKSYKWIAENNILYCPFIEIKGFGDKTAKYAEEIKTIVCRQQKKKSFYKKEKVVKDKQKLTQRFINILSAIKSDCDEETTGDFADSISKYFSFSFNRDPYRRFRRMIDKLSVGIDLKKIKDFDFTRKNEKHSYFFGKMTEIKFSYRDKIDLKGNSSKANSFGGVYGNFKDEEDFSMLVFDSEIYLKKKNAIEHCSDEFILAKATNPNRKTGLLCSDAWMQSELLSADFEGLGLNIIEERRFRNKELTHCTSCALRRECSSPVLPSTGKNNIMIIGEAPGKDEDRLGTGFSGKAGKVLWEALSRYGYDRKQFNVTNVVKCFPSQSKTPKLTEIGKCSKWLEEEIENISPCLILALGNTNIKFFTGEESGIMNKSGTTEWNDKYGCWICWGIHPASVLYSPENKSLFDKSIKNFVKKIRLFGNI